jgi:hypothetical protein
VTSLRRTADGIVVSFDEVEASLLRHLVGEVRGLLADDEPSAEPPGGAGASGPETWPGGPATWPDRGRPAGPAPYHRGGRAGRDTDPAAEPTAREPRRRQDDLPDDLPDDALLAELTGLGGPVPSPPDDPVLARLLPDGYRDDAEAAGEFRRLTEASLREEKRRAAAGVLADLPGSDGGEVRLDRPTVERWLTVLNDVRLALGTRLDVAEDMPEPDPDDPEAPAYVVYLWLTGLQEVLLGVAAET